MLNLEQKKESFSSNVESEPMPGRGKKVLFIVPQPFFEDRGSPFRVKVSVESLSALGYEVDLLVLPFGEEVSIPRVNIVRTWKIPFIKEVKIGPSFTKLFFDVLLLVKALQLGLTKKYAVVHGVEEGGIIAAVLGRLTSTPYIFDMHSCMSEQLSSTALARIPFFIRLIELIERLSIRRAAGVVTVGEEHKSRVGEICASVPCCAVEDIPLDPVIENYADVLMRVKKEFGLEEKKVVVYTGNFEPYQGIDLLLESWAASFSSKEGTHSGHRERVTLLLVGGGSQDGAEILRYKKLARDRGIADSVIFTGQRPAQEMGVFMDLSSVLVSPRISGANTPLKIYSYMAAKRPILATRIRSHMQVLSDETAFLVDCCARDFGKTLASLLVVGDVEKEKESASVVEKAFELVNARFSKDEFLRRYASLYRQVS